MSASDAADTATPLDAIVHERSSITRNATALSVANVTARIFVLGLAVAIGRGLGVDEYGRYGFAVAVAMVIVPVADFGITTYLWREVAWAGTDANRSAAHLARIKTGLSLAALVLAGAATLLVTSASEAVVIIVVLAGGLADGMSAYVFGFFQGREQMGFEATWTVATALIRSVGGIVLVLVTGRLLPVLLWMLAVSGVQLLVAMIRFRGTVSMSGTAATGPRPVIAWRSLIAMGALGVSVLVYIRADSVLLGIIKGQHTVGLYTAAYSLMGAAQLVPLQISQAVIPALSRTFRRDRLEFLATWDGGMWAIVVIALPLALLTSVLSRGVVSLPYGSAYASASTALAVLIWASPLGVVNALVAGALYAAGEELWPAVVSVFAVILNVGLNLWAIPAFGVAGAAGVTVATEVLVLGLQVRHLVARGVAPVPRLPYRGLALALASSAGAGLVARPLGTVVAGLLGIAAYLAIGIATGALSRRWTSLLRHRPVAS
ncbi:MAG: flippase [Solirubrobacteraceae bacterium]